MGITYNQNNVTGRRNSGATEYPITIGDGINSWGRFNAAPRYSSYGLQTKVSVSLPSEPTFDITIDSNGYTHLVFISNADQNVVYATNQSGSWVTTVVATHGLITRVAIEISANGYINIIYVIGTGAIRYAYKTVVGGSWNVVATDIVAGTPIGISIVIDSQSYISIGFYDNPNIKIAKKNQIAGTSNINWTVTSITTSGIGRSQVICDNTDTTYIVTDSNTSGILGIYLFSNTGVLLKTIDPSGAPVFIMSNRSSKVDQTNNFHGAFRDTTNDKIVHFTFALPSGTVTSTDITANGSNSHYPSIDTSNFGFVSIVHHQVVAANYNLKLSTNISGAWVTSNIDTSAAQSTAYTIYKPMIRHYNNKVSIVFLDDNPSLEIYHIDGVLNFSITSIDAINNAIKSLPSTGGQIEFLQGDFLLDSDIIINKSNVKVAGNGANTKINITDSYKIRVGTVATTGVSISNLKLNAVTPARVAATPLLELVAGTSTNCFVTDVVFSEDAGVNTKDIEWTIANGHIVDSNISTTNTSGLGGI